MNDNTVSSVLRQARSGDVVAIELLLDAMKPLIHKEARKVRLDLRNDLESEIRLELLRTLKI